MEKECSKEKTSKNGQLREECGAGTRTIQSRQPRPTEAADEFEILQVAELTQFKSMNLVLEREAPPLHEDETGAIRVENSRVLLEIVIRAFQDGASPESQNMDSV